MRILVSLENAQHLELLCSKLRSFFSIVGDEDLFVDILHVYEPPKVAKPFNTQDMIEQIRKDEQKNKLRMIANLENTIENFLLDKLDKKSLVNSHLLEGDYKTQLEKHIIFHRYDLLILNPDRRRDFDTILKGRNTHWIIDNLEIPVLVMPTYLTLTEGATYDITCFVDTLLTYKNLSEADIFTHIENDKIRYIHFGKDKVHENVETVFSSNTQGSISSYTSDEEHNHIFVLHHKNKGDFLNFLDKSFTKKVISSLENPLLIF